jgi:hypothetical protein
MSGETIAKDHQRLTSLLASYGTIQSPSASK